MLNTLKIGTFQFSVSLAERKENYDGQLKHSRSAIYISDDMDKQATLETLIHEVVHEIAIQAGQELKEGAVDAIAYGWIQVMRDNPALVRMITK